jgi:hypothetical protein
METVTLIIAGDLAKYAIDGAASGRVMAGMTETFTVKALDANDNPADASGQKPNILITGPGKDAVSVLDLTSGELRPLNANGQNTFRIYVLPDAPSSHINITVLGEAGTDPVSMKVYIGSNQAPMAGAAIDDQTIEIGSMAMVQSTLSDADGQMLSYMAISSDEMVATAEVDDTGMVTITAEAVGIATITVTATDTDGAMGTQDITVRLR